jgi:hypothetical protein
MRATHPGGFEIDVEILEIDLTLEQASSGSVGIMIPKMRLEGMLGPKFAWVDEAWRPTEPLCERSEGLTVLNIGESN